MKFKVSLFSAAIILFFTSGMVSAKGSHSHIGSRLGSHTVHSSHYSHYSHVGSHNYSSYGRSSSIHSTHYRALNRYHSSTHYHPYNSFRAYTGHLGSDVFVNSYIRKGSLVSAHHRTYPDTIFYNNWSTKGNINPYTGEPGYKTHP